MWRWRAGGAIVSSGAESGLVRQQDGAKACQRCSTILPTLRGRSTLSSAYEARLRAQARCEVELCGKERQVLHRGSESAQRRSDMTYLRYVELLSFKVFGLLSLKVFG